MTRKYRRFALAAFLTALLDLGSKAWVERTFAPFESVPIVEGWFHLTYVKNPGVAFGMMAGGSSWRAPLIALVTVFALGLILFLLRRVQEEVEPLSPLWLGMVFGGALGNLVDRLRYGEVVDFLDVFWKTHHWPTFNVADAAISVGIAALLAGDLLRHRRAAG